jgi:hypothetical protein
VEHYHHFFTQDAGALVVKELSIADTKPYKKQLMGVFPG